MKINRFNEALYIPNDMRVWNKVRDALIESGDEVGIQMDKKQWETMADAVVDALHSISVDRKYKPRHRHED